MVLVSPCVGLVQKIIGFAFVQNENVVFLLVFRRGREGFAYSVKFNIFYVLHVILILLTGVKFSS